MRQTISGLAAVIAVVTASVVPAMACGRFEGCWVYERLPDPEQQYHHAQRYPQYYYVNQGPAFTGPGDFAPIPIYREGAVSSWASYRHHPYYGGARWRHRHRYSDR
jgi:hypothetical protein